MKSWYGKLWKVIKNWQNWMWNIFFLMFTRIHKITKKKNPIIQEYKNRVLKMSLENDWNEIITALNSTWMRKIMKSNSKWTKQPEEIKELWQKGLDFTRIALNRLTIFREINNTWIWNSICEDIVHAKQTFNQLSPVVLSSIDNRKNTLYKAVIHFGVRPA